MIGSCSQVGTMVELKSFHWLFLYDVQIIMMKLFSGVAF